LTAAGRAEPGCVRFDAFRGDELGEFVLLIHWRDEDALQAHYRGAGYTRYRAAVGELLARPSDVAVHHVAQSVHAIDPGPPDPGLFG
jgi:quinol monooxygenase YgiN